MLLAVETCSAGVEWSQFEWIGSTIGDKTFDRAAILVPVKLKNNPKTFWMQLDTGTDVTVLYQLPFSQLKYPAQPIKGQEDFVALSGSIGNCPFDSFPVFMYKDFGDSLNDKKEHPVNAYVIPTPMFSYLFRKSYRKDGKSDEASNRI